MRGERVWWAPGLGAGGSVRAAALRRRAAGWAPLLLEGGREGGREVCRLASGNKIQVCRWLAAGVKGLLHSLASSL